MSEIEQDELFNELFSSENLFITFNEKFSRIDEQGVTKLTS